MAYRAEIETAAVRHGIDADLVDALVWRESDHDTDAWNPEPRYRWFWNVRTNEPFRRISDAAVSLEVPPPDFPCLAGDRDQEWWAQQASWGLMQIMGAVAREYGFRGPYLTKLCSDPSLNLDIGCTVLAALLKWARGQYQGLAGDEVAWVRRRALAAYNGGKGGAAEAGPQDYAKQVIARWVRLRADAGKP